METWPEQKVLVVTVNADAGERRAFDRNRGIDAGGCGNCQLRFLRLAAHPVSRPAFMLMAGSIPLTTRIWPLASIK